ncbi:class I SAM-dependent methyltransferase [Polynucleobacter sp. UB-Siik-W21]|uniref:class I SAM-dependent methyltransferase n=1 Tax=Polynucleobacter sp. UB-Siik-W21 TaxID=1855646 RepID=UPI001BFDA126|nr:class I SAM-dependent methyltransferase [Polynucleobacter sp. UB-Siik-W21]QWD70716.1 methyltransferase domain-containing protein [Polynucleobacter sp. UB-Siik-W21]
MQKFYPCPICNSTASFIFTSKHKRNIYKCSNKLCGHFHTKPFNHDQGICIRPENIIEVADKTFETFSYRNSQLVKLFQEKISFTKNKPSLLDYGSGYAHMSRYIKNTFSEIIKIYCFEPNPIFQDLYSKNNLIQVANLSTIQNKLDLAFMIEVIEHIPDPINALSELSKAMEPKGYLFISTPVGRSFELLTNAYETPSHLHFFTPMSLNIALLKSGFSAIDFNYCPAMYKLKPDSDLMSWFYSLLKIIFNKALVFLFKDNGIRHIAGFTQRTN